MKATDLSNMDSEKFGCMSGANRIWALGAIHGEVLLLRSLHRQILDKFRRGDKIIYLGNFFGPGSTNLETMDELLLSRRRMMSLPEVFMPDDFIYLRGAREEMFTKLLQLQFAPNPAEVMEWLLDHEMGSVIEAYGTRINVARAISREGTLSISKWTNGLRRALHENQGHGNLMSSLRRAAFTREGKLLFVHASVDPSRPLTLQKDNFWWDNGRFDKIDHMYSGFYKVIRGYDHANKGLVMDRRAIATLDGGCGRGGSLHAVCFSPDGDILDHLSES